MNKIIYLDAAASSLKPESVIKVQQDFLQNHYANAGRGICARSIYVDKTIAQSRKKVAEFIKTNPENIVFTSGTTDGMNRIVNIIRGSDGFVGRPKVMVSDLDHHSARMPWEEAVNRGEIRFSLCPLDSEFNIDYSKIEKTDILVITAMSNVLGAPQDVKKIIEHARKLNKNVITIVDAAQYVANLPIDVSDWDADFICFSGHKIGADTGVGIMYIKEPARWYPDKFGGGMVAKISGSLDNNDSKWTLESAPMVFEAGTLPITQIVGLPFAIDELQKHNDKQKLIKYLHTELSKIERIKILTKPDSHILTFVVNDMHCMDFGTLMGANGVCLRVGSMCASWIHKILGYNGTIRISVGQWNTMEEMKEVVKIIKKILEK